MINMKMLILPRGERAELTFEETYQKFLPLLRKQAYKWFQYEKDEILQTAAIGLWKAYEKYNVELGYSFSGVAKKFVEYEVWNYHLKHRPKFDRKTSQIKSMKSLQSAISNKDGSETEMMDLIGIEETFSKDITEQIIFRKIFSHFSKYQIQDILRYVDGYSKKEIANKGRKMETINHNFNKFRVLYLKEMMSS